MNKKFSNLINNIVLTIILLFSINAIAIAQELNFIQNRTVTFNKDYDFPIDFIRSGLTIDNQANKIIAGGFTGKNVDFGDTNLISSEKNYNAYLAKYNENDELLWLKNIGGTVFRTPNTTLDYFTFDFISDISVDSENNIYAMATIDVATPETIDLDPEHPNTNSIITSNNITDFIPENRNIFLIKYTPNGELLWYKEIQDAHRDISLELFIDPNDHVFCTGYLNGLTSNFIDFDASQDYSDNRDIMQNSFVRLGFIAQYDTDGNFKNVHGIEGAGTVSQINVKNSLSENIYASGSFHATNTDFSEGLTVFKNSALPLAINSLGNTPEDEDIFIVKYNNTGQILWLNTISSPSKNRVVEMHIDENENVFVSGYVNGASVDFDKNDSSPTGIFNTSSKDAAFIAKYNTTDGSLNWVKTITGGNFSRIRDLSIKNNKIVLGGEFNGTINIGTTELQTNITNPFIAIMDINGNWEVAKKIEKNTSSAITDVTITDNGIIHYFGFEGKITTNNNEYEIEKMFLGKANNSLFSLLSVNQPNKKLKKFSIVPNPTTDYINIQFEEIKSNIKVKIYTLLGQMTLSKEYINIKSEVIDINTFSPGIYILQIEENGTVINQSKIIKK